MYFDFRVSIPKEKSKIYERTIKGVTYINYEYDRIYKPDKKYNIPKRTTIGKKCEDWNLHGVGKTDDRKYAG